MAAFLFDAEFFLFLLRWRSHPPSKGHPTWNTVFMTVTADITDWCFIKPPIHIGKECFVSHRSHDLTWTASIVKSGDFTRNHHQRELFPRLSVTDRKSWEVLCVLKHFYDFFLKAFLVVTAAACVHSPNAPPHYASNMVSIGGLVPAQPLGAVAFAPHPSAMSNAPPPAPPAPHKTEDDDDEDYDS